MRKRQMDKGRRILALLCSALFLGMAGTSSIYAESAASASIDSVGTEENQCVLYVNHNQGDGWNATPENSVLTIADQTCTIDSIEMLKNTQTAVSYVCMVDISGSMSQDRIDAVKAMIGQLADGKKETDNFCITTMGDNLVSSDFMQDAGEIKAYADGIVVTKEDTNLYQGIKDELSMMQTNKNVHAKRCLIIFSDGADDQTAGITRDEAVKAVADSSVPVFTVAMLKEKPTQAQTEAAKILGSFARSSAGGVHYAPVVDGFANSEVPWKIKSVINSSFVVKASVNGVTVSGDTAKAGLTLSDGSIAAAAEYQISGAAATAIAQLGAPEEVEEIPEEGLDMAMILVFVGIGAVVLIGIIVIVSRKMRRENPGDEILYAKKADVVLEPVKGNGEPRSFAVKDEVKIGRGRRCQLCLKDDNALSELHASLQWKQGELYVKDENSTNGTYVNGVPIVGEYRLEQGDILLLGSYEYKISWR